LNKLVCTCFALTLLIFAFHTNLFGQKQDKILIVPPGNNSYRLPYAYKRMLSYNNLTKEFAKKIIENILMDAIAEAEHKDSVEISKYEQSSHLKSRAFLYRSRNTDLLKEIENSKGWKRNILLNKVYPKHFCYRRAFDQRTADYLKQIQSKEAFSKVIFINYVEFRHFGKQRQRMTAYLHLEYFDKDLFSYHAKRYPVEFPFKIKMYFNVFKYTFKKQLKSTIKPINA